MESTIRIPNVPSWFGDRVDTTKDATALRRSLGVSSHGGTESMGTNLIILCALGGSLALPDQSFFGGRGKAAPTSERVKELLQTLKTSGDEGLRIGAVDELRLLDTQSNAPVVAALVETLKTDRKPGVRAEAAVSLARMRPVRTEIGHALEYTIAKDASMRVRMQARSALLQYNLAGYRSTAPLTNSPEQLDPLGEIAQAEKQEKQETPAAAARPWTWMAFQNNWFGTPSDPQANAPGAKPAATDGQPAANGNGVATAAVSGTAPASQPAAETRSWYRPGKALAGWFQSTFGSQRAEAKESGSSMPPIAPAGLNLPASGMAAAPSPKPGAPGRTVSNSNRSNAPSPDRGSQGNASSPAPIPMFPPVPEFQPGSPNQPPETQGPELGKPDR